MWSPVRKYGGQRGTWPDRVCRIESITTWRRGDESAESEQQVLTTAADSCRQRMSEDGHLAAATPAMRLQMLSYFNERFIEVLNSR